MRCPVCRKSFSKTDPRQKVCSLSCAARLPRKREDPVTRFWKNVVKGDSCWLWSGSLAAAGYGRFTIRYEVHLAHRYSWELHNGPIPDGLWVLHDCPDGDNPACVNPSHLWLGTAADNTADMVRKGRDIKGEKQPNSKLTNEDVIEIRRLFESTKSLRQRDPDKFSIRRLADMFSVHMSNVSCIILRKSWTHI